MFVIGILSQGRGAGTPPPLVILQSKDKFLKTIQEDRKASETQLGLIRCCLLELRKNIPKEATTGLATKARVSVTTSAVYENTVKEGGGSEALR